MKPINYENSSKKEVAEYERDAAKIGKDMALPVKGKPDSQLKGK